MKNITKKTKNTLQPFIKILFLLLATHIYSQNIWINEIKYDNVGQDVDDTIEIAGSDNIDLEYYSLVLYNGNNGSVYETLSLSGIIPNEQNGFGAIAFTIPNGIQNGPDGFALINSYNEVIQFLSYEGSFTAIDGPANGMTSTDIGITGSNSSAGKSIQLQGTGYRYDDFVWTEEVLISYNSLNPSQIFPKSPLFNLWINEIKFNNPGPDVDDTIEIAGSDGIDLSNFKIALYNGNNGLIYETIYLSGVIPNQSNGYGTLAFTISNGIQNGTDGMALVDLDNNVIQFLSYGGVFTATDGSANGMTSTDIGIVNLTSTTNSSIQLQGSGNTYSDFTWTEDVPRTYNTINSNQNFEAKTFIQDVNFEQALIELGYDTGVIDHFVTTANINTITSLYIYERSIANSTGIEDFEALENLFIYDNQIKKIDISNLTALSQFRCHNNQLTELNITNNSMLNRLNCSFNLLNAIDISLQPNFLILDCSNNPISSLDFSQNPNLIQISCKNTLISDLDVSMVTNLQYLFCNNNLISNLDLSQNNSISSIRCQGNQLTSLNLKNGNNSIINDFNATNNPSLSCIEVDNVSFSSSNWVLIDSNSVFSTDCSQAANTNDYQLNKINIYPNPTKNSFKIKSSLNIQKVEIYNHLGALIKTFHNQENYYLNNINSGMYIIKISTESSTRLKRLIIE